MEDVYAVVAHYLRRREAMEAYLAERELRAREVRRTIEEHQGGLTDLRNRLLARRGSA